MLSFKCKTDFLGSSILPVNSYEAYFEQHFNMNR